MRAIIFDLDGVIVYTDRYHYLGWKRLADEEGFAFDETLNDRLRGVSRMASLEIILDHNDIDLPDAKKKELAERKNGYYRDSLAEIDESALVDGALDFVRAVRDLEVRTAIGSSSKNAGFVLQQLGIRDLFDAVVTGHDITRSKPDPQIFLLGAERLGLDPAACAVFEDAVSGVEAANAGGFLSVGFGPTPGLEIADVLVPTFAEIDPTEFVRMEASR